MTLIPWSDGSAYALGGVQRSFAQSLLTPAASGSVGLARLATSREGITSFTFPLNLAGKLTNRLVFCDPVSGPGDRIMNIRVNGVLFAQNYDIFAHAGKAGRETFLDLTEVDPGAGVNVSFEPVVGLTWLTAAYGIPGGATPVSTPIVVTPPVTGGTTVVIDDTDLTKIAYTGAWNTSTDAGDAGGSDHYTSSQTAYLTVNIHMTQDGSVELWAKKAAHHGIATAKYDGAAAIDVDLYNATDALKQRVLVTNLAAGDHVLVYAATGRRNASSSGSTIQIDQIVVNNGDAVVITAPSGGGGGVTPTGFLTRVGRDMKLNGVTAKFPGMNWDTIHGCWDGEKEAAQANSAAAVHRYFEQSPHTSITRIWCMPGSDLAWMDTIVGIAEANNQMVSIVLFNGNADCSGISPPSYAPGTNSDELSWIASVCSRPALKNSKAVAWWEIINEPNGNDANCKSFLDEMAAAIKAQDPNHMIASGTMPEYTFPSHAAYVDAHAGPNIDIVMWSSYSGDFSDWGPQAVAAGATLNKPAVCREKGTCCGGATTGTYAGDAQVLTRWEGQFLDQEGVSCLQWWDFKMVHPAVQTVSFDTPMWDAWSGFDHASMVP